MGLRSNVMKTRIAAVVCCKTSSESSELRESGDGARSLLRGCLC